MSRKLFCEISPLTYRLSLIKERYLRNFKDFSGGYRFAKQTSDKPLDCLVKSHSSLLIRNLNGIDPRLQENKVTNLRIAAATFNGIIIQPGETFSFWRSVGNATKSKGYLPGLTVSSRHGLGEGVGGGLCQLANMVHWLVLNSPLEVTELHHHSDALFPDERRRVPFGTGTSVFYNNIDYRFQNTSNQNVQLLVWLDGEFLNGELRSEHPFPNRYRIIEEDDRFCKEGDEYYRLSKVYKLTLDSNNQEVNRELVLDNHSKVLYDCNLIPKEKICND